MNIEDNPILTAEQKSLLLAFSRSELRSSFCLTGGTCLSAFYLFHRLSEDLDLFFGLKKNPEVSLRHLLQATEAKFGIKGVSHIVKGRFLEDAPPLGALNMRETLDPEAIVRFFKHQALSLISDDLRHGS